MADPTVAVVGGGVAGLAAAWELANRPAGGRPLRILVLEADRFGGRLAAAEFGGRTVDVAADGFLARRPEAAELAVELGLEAALVPVGASGASVWARGRLRSLPSSLNLGVPTRWLPLARSGILTPAESLSAASDLVRPHRRPEVVFGDRSVADIVGRRLGRPVVERLADPLIGGIHAGSADELSAAALFPLLIAADQQPGSLMRRLRRAQPAADPSSPAFLSLRTSTASLVDGLARALAGRGVDLRGGVRVDAVGRTAADGRGPRFSLALRTVTSRRRPAAEPSAGDVPAGLDRAGSGTGGAPTTVVVDALVLATPAPETAVLLAPMAPKAAGLIAAVEHASVATITLALPAGTIGGRPGTGFLVPRSAPVDGRVPLVTACTYLDRKWPHLCAPGSDLVRLSVGRHRDERHLQLDDAELLSAAIGELARYLGTAAARRPLDSLVTRWPAAFPQYTVGHLVRVGELTAEVDAVGGVALAGASYRGVGLPACIGSGREAARRVLEALSPGTTRAPAGR